MAEYDKVIRDIEGQLSSTGFAWVLKESLKVSLDNISTKDPNRALKDALDVRLNAIEVKYFSNDSKKPNQNNRPKEKGVEADGNSQTSYDSRDAFYDYGTIKFIDPDEDYSEDHDEEDDQEGKHADGSAL